ncbi:MAG TPA: Rieske (2Fe-2S) protein [Candidatus Eisenbacteria bacterium]|nr:Rieske (2Fe-2S) protein [Candidatus Eisenbacteria bacterium]
MSPTRVAVYDRTIRASLERIWENVLDWEHLPWLHRESFGHVRLLDESSGGFRAELSVRGDPTPFVIDVAIDRANLVYHSRTVDGPGTGSDIVTTLAPVADHATNVHVEFLLPRVKPSSVESVGRLYVGLYTLLWDQDEAMMIRRQAFVDGRLARTTCEAVVGGAPVRFSSVCPHLGGPLDGAAVEDGCVTCPWHGYRFDVRTGRRVDGDAPALPAA